MFDGILAWYSMIHTPPPEATLLIEHTHEALRPGTRRHGWMRAHRN